MVEDVRPFSRTSSSTCRKIKYSKRRDTPGSCPANDHRWSATQSRVLAPHRRKFFAASRRPRVTFQVDHVDEVWEDGWSLLAFGRLRAVEEPAELARVRHLPLRPWAGGDRPHFLALDIDSLSGRRIVG